MSKTIITSKKINDLKDYKFRIPLYQRPYAWGEDEIEQLIVDLNTFKDKDQNKNKDQNKKYFLGNIVVSKNGKFYDVIVG